MQELEGQTIQHFRILRPLARGGMANIYLAQDTLSLDDVVIKMVPTSNHDYCERFRYEIQATTTLQHEHILPALAHGEHDSWCYMVSPYIEGGTLQDRLAQGPLSFTEIDQILEQLASALQFAHDSGLLHRDIKPSNILLRNQKHVLLADFGLAKPITKDDLFTTTNQLIGTPEYMAPELAEEQASISSDIYALGVILYQLLTGQLPFKGSTPMGTYLKHIREEPLPPTTLNPQIPEMIENVLLRALAKNPRHRFDSVHDLASAYHAALAQHTRQISLLTSLLRRRTLAATVQLKASTGNQIYRSTLGMVTAFCFLLMPTILGFAFFYGTHHNAPVSVQTQGIDLDIPPAQPGRKATVPTAPPPTTPPQPLLSIQATKNENTDCDPCNSPPQDTDDQDSHKNHGHNHGDKNQGQDNGSSHGKDTKLMIVSVTSHTYGPDM